MFGRTVSSLFAVSFFCALPAFAAPCPGKILFQDSFAKANAGWNFTPASDGSKPAIENGKFVLHLATSSSTRTELYQGDVYDDANICITVKAPEADKPETRSAGISFWGKDYNSYYMFWISTAGNYGVSRLTGGRWITPISPTPSAAIKKGGGQTNTIRVQTKGDDAILFVNDQQIATISGHAAEGGSLAGFYGDSSSATGNVWEFTDFTVSKP